MAGEAESPQAREALAAQTDDRWDADTELAAEFAATLLGEPGEDGSSRRLILSTGLDCFLAAQPDAEGMSELDWNLAEAETLEEGFASARLAGAEALATQTLHLAAATLERGASAYPLNVDEVARAAKRAAQSAGPHFIVGAIGRCCLAWPQAAEKNQSSEDARQEYELECDQVARHARALYRAEAQAFEAAGTHALLVGNMPDVKELLLAVEAAAQVSERAVIAQLPGWSQAGERAFEQLARAGAHAIVGEVAGCEAAEEFVALAEGYNLVAIPQVGTGGATARTSGAVDGASAGQLARLAQELGRLGAHVIATAPTLSAAQVSAVAGGFLWEIPEAMFLSPT